MADAEQWGVEAVDITMGESTTPMTMAILQLSASRIATVPGTGVERKHGTGFGAPTASSNLTRLRKIIPANHGCVGDRGGM